MEQREPAVGEPIPAKRKRGRGNWRMRSTAVLGTAAALAGLWHVILQTPYPADAAPGVTPTPTDSFTIPTGSDLPPLPTIPHSGTGLSH